MSSEPSTKGPQRSVLIGRYKVVSHIATGGMGAVYKAFDPKAQRDVALKVLSPELAAKPVMVERFRREGKHAAKLRHENIVTVYECGEANGHLYIAMEFVEGIDLGEYVERKGPLDPEEALKIIVQATKALDHVHRKGIVHRDIKPSNFMVTRNAKGRLLVKMTDLGLAREADADEFRVTRAGTTVGTVDYISPEQARDSGRADVRSDLYSLGCTWYHLLAGRAPFAEGGLAERLHKHLSVDPPDVRQFNPRASRATVAVLRRLLAKRPADRYQTPTELLRDLADLAGGGEPRGSRAVKLGLLDDADAARTAVAPSARAKPNRARRPAAAKGKGSDPARRKPAPRAHLWYILGGVAAGLLVLVAVVLALLLRPTHEASDAGRPAGDSASVLPPSVTPPGPVVQNPPPDHPPDGPPDKAPNQPPGKPRWPVLDPLAKPVDAVTFRKEVEAPWANVPPRSADAPVFHVARTAAAGAGPVYPTLAAAAAAAPADRTAVLEIDDDGPLFEPSNVFTDRQLVICAGRGFRPLVVWDAARLAKDGGRPGAFLTVERGGLRLENVDVVFSQPDAAPGGLALLDARDADLSAEGCTFSLAGRPRDGAVLARFHGTRPDAALCRFVRCLARGPGLVALDIDAPGAAVLFDRCLVVGGEPALLRVHASDARTTKLAAVRSTLVCGRTLLDVRRAAGAGGRPQVSWLGWDSLLARAGDRPGGDLMTVEAGAGVNTTGMSWRAVNCLYAGWLNLLAGPETIAGTDTAKWQVHWERSEGDLAIRDAWPAFNDDPSVLPASAYRTAGAPVAFAATADPNEMLGCDPAQLPPTRDNWPGLTTDSFPVPPIEPIADDTPPVVDPAVDQLYHGGRIDLSQTNLDIGAMLRDLQQQHKLAPRVVLLLSGAGEHAITPFRLQGTTLVLYADPPKEDAAPLTLRWDGQGALGQDGLVEIDGGGLDLINVGLKSADFPRAAAPECLLKVRGGLRLFRCRLDGPQQYVTDPYKCLIELEGSGEPAADKACNCAVNESVLVSGRDGIRVRGVGARLLLRQSVGTAGGDALHVDPGPNYAGRANGQCVLEHSTLAFRRAAVHLEDAAQQTDGPPAEPMVVSSRECAFLDPFGEKAGPAGLLAYEKAALAHGLLVWQADGDAFGKRLTFGAAPVSALPDKDDVRAAWGRLWGSYGDRRPAADVPPGKPFDAFPWPLDRLAPQKAASLDRRPPGADFTLLRLVKKPAKP